jgi:hypothetical protein
MILIVKAMLPDPPFNSILDAMFYIFPRFKTILP